jgi:hypothetical protein
MPTLVGRTPADVPVLVALEVEELGTDLAALAASWQARGAAELIVHDVKADELDAVLALAPQA